MHDIWQVIAELSIELSPARIESAAAVIEKLESSEDTEFVPGLFGPNIRNALWTRLIESWSRHPKITPDSLASGLRAGSQVSQVLAGGQSVSLAWTGPKTDFVPVRSTEQVMLEVIQRAETDLFLVSFVNVGARTIVAALNESAERRVNIRMLLEESKDAAEKLKDAVPSAEVYIWTEASKLKYGSPPTASVHAKCVIADEKEAFVSSANLTDYALEKNMELGVHIVGGRQPQVLAAHFSALITTEQIKMLT